MIERIKAAELIVNYQIKVRSLDYNEAKQCALVTVDEIIDAIDWHEFETPNIELKYWQKVKQEIEKS